MNKREIFDNLKVVVIGAGIAGLAAAVTLYEHGVENIAILEAQSVPGGRIKTVNFGGGYVDLGAQWLHGTKNELCRMAKENGLISPQISFEGLGNFYYGSGKVVPANVVHDVNNEVEKIMSHLEKSYNKHMPESVGEYMTSKFEEYLDSCEDSMYKEVKKELFDWHLRFQMIDNGCLDLRKLSSKAFGEYKFCGGQDYVNFKCGFQSIVDLLVSKLPDGCLFTSCPVKTIRWKENVSFLSENICEILTDNGAIFSAEHVIVTCPVGYLKSNWSMFWPELPLEYVKHFNCIGFDTINKIYLEYEEMWWGSLQGIQLVWNSEERKEKLKDSPELWTCDISGFDPVIDAPNVLVGWVGGEGALLMEKLSSNEIGIHCTNLLRTITGNKDIPEPINCVNSSWHSNKYIKGGYSHITVERERYKMVLSSLLKPVSTVLPDGSKHPSLMFAGEALHDTYYSTTHGAFESGKSQANRLINYIKCS